LDEIKTIEKIECTKRTKRAIRRQMVAKSHGERYQGVGPCRTGGPTLGFGRVNLARACGGAVGLKPRISHDADTRCDTSVGGRKEKTLNWLDPPDCEQKDKGV